MNFDFSQLKTRIDQEYDEIEKEIKKPNILIVGCTGVGKSSLINTCFKKKIADTGTGKPITQNIFCYSDDNIGINLYDTKGYELGTENHKEFVNEVYKYAVNNKKSPENKIHLVWYCIDSSGARILDFDIQIIKALSSAGIPVAVVLTKADRVSEEDTNALDNELKKIKKDLPVFQTTIYENFQYLELDKLCSWSEKNLSKGLKFAFVSSQKVNLGIKKDQARKAILQHTGGAAFVGLSPIPFSDAPLLILNQSGLIARILYIYNLNFLNSHIKDLLVETGLSTLISKFGIWISGELLKLLPGIGTVAGNLINASVASSVTSALGFSVSEFCYRIYKIVLSGNYEELENFLAESETIFKAILKENNKTNKEKE
jgi:small GTP-binding protein